LLDGNVQSLWSRVERRVLLANITDGGGIDERHEIADVVHKKAVEQVNVLILEV
jgi:hypothetical protein